ncbi:hypothetical protein [Tenggerimyces flavus]|uniref:Lipoprotein n=1 Tax=Tenggerimyces flavus TaxID=1708749 RepID=A0ABV7YCG0_9ACTN|nr:hypothetical protein [Tenggerimyces flavus]MBM7786585.1 hypothetical protein [Tenggerimyces flavus]
MIFVLAVLIVGAIVAVGILGGGESSNADPRPQQPTSPASPTATSTPAAPRTAAEPIEAALTKLAFECFTTIAKPATVRGCYHSTEGVDIAVKLQLDKGGLVGAAHIDGALSNARRVSGLARYTEVTDVLGPLVVGKQDAAKLPKPEDGSSGEMTGGWGYASSSVNGSFAEYRLMAKGYDLVTPSIAARMPEVDLRKALAGKGFVCDDRTCSINFPDEGTGYTSFSLTYNNIAWTATLNQMRKNEEQAKRLGLPRFKEIGAVAIGQTDNGELAAWLDKHWKQPTPQSADFGGLHVELRYGEPLGPSIKFTPARSW